MRRPRSAGMGDVGTDGSRRTRWRWASDRTSAGLRPPFSVEALSGTLECSAVQSNMEFLEPSHNCTLLHWTSMTVQIHHSIRQRNLETKDQRQQTLGGPSLTTAPTLAPDPPPSY